ncbi:related to transcription factors [Ramularia collo-cygni]|uniref:Related to transcription factors n=1 Tax=Ramularia collo-cygni TaxID=112498 RepID=A0A2D3UTD0_9PEZI|nr:related to transcription factors [Ramularia collo-cygni]CZT15067.1 related to transcription factors [Ramularia collo-cygni]
MASPVAEEKQQAGAVEESAKPASPAPIASPKRKHSEATTENGLGENGAGKKKRRKVNHACVYCRRSHMTCDLQRPCARCVKRDIGHLCHDEPRDPPKRSKSDMGVPEIAPAPSEGVDAVANGQAELGAGIGRIPFSHAEENVGMASTNGNGAIAMPLPTSPPPIQRPIPTGSNTNNASGLLQNYDWNNSNVRNQFQDMHHLHPNYMFNTSEVTNEYNLLNDFLSNSIIDDGGIYTNNDDVQALFNDPLLATSSMNALNASLQQPQPTNNASSSRPPAQTQAGLEISRPSSAFPVDTRARDKFYMTAADPAGLSSAEDRLHKLLKAKYDAGMLKPFNYVKGYARLNQHMSSNLSRESSIRILKQLDRFRPKFREAMHSLTDMQLVLVEMWFERSLMEYDRVFASMAIPACCWRRTGEIFRGNTEMAELIRVPLDKLRDGKLAIHEIIAEDSLVSYWEKFGAIAFDQSQKAILTSCTLRRPIAGATNGTTNGGGSEVPMETVRCCFSFTIRRDSHNIPSLIVGNFLPITPRREPS